MKHLFTKSIFPILLCFFAFNSYAQPAYDDCDGIWDLGVVPYCVTDFFTNLDATESNIGAENFPICWNGAIPQRDVWIQFTASDTITDYRITVTGTSENGEQPMMMPQVTIYRGDCQFNGLSNYGFCEQADIGEMEVIMDVNGLDPNEIYFLRINDYSVNATPNWGTFQLCVEEVPPISTIDEGGSMQCSGDLYDSGGPDGNYAPNENNAFTICPNILTECINFSLEYYNIDNSGFGDQIAFYDGPDTSSPLIGNPVEGSGMNFGQSNGGVCFNVSASSGCLTVEFISDGSLEFEGFHGSWECSTEPCEQSQDLTINDEITETEIINALATSQSSITITSIDCPNGAMGVYDNGDNNELGSQKGLILTSGSAVDVANQSNFFTSQIHNTPGDADLDALSLEGNGQLSNDACIIELDVFAATNELSFEYIFGSEEYPEFVNSNFNDIFAFLISGPGINGPANIGGQENIAILPVSGTAVEINSVNNTVNWNYYRDNVNGQGVAYDGLTSDFNGVKKTLTAHSLVEPCNTYHLKLAIADRGDASFDSGVFISEISGGAPQMSYAPTNGFNYLVENCNSTEDQIKINLTAPQEEALTYTVTISGSAELGVDYNLDITNTITFLAGQTTLFFPISVINDFLVEGDENILITLSNDFGCGDIVQAQLEVIIHDELNVDINLPDTALLCSGDSILLEAIGALDYEWFPVNDLTDPNISTPFADPAISQYYYVEGSLNTCSDIDSIWVEVIDPMIEINALSSTEICVGDTVFLEVTNNVGDAGLTTTDIFGFIPDENASNPIFVPTFNFDNTVTSTVTLGGCSVSTTIEILVDNFNEPNIITDTIVCQGYPIQLSNDFGLFGVNYNWTPEASVVDPSIVNATGIPTGPIDFELIASSDRGFCADTSNVFVDVSPSEINIVPDSIFICNVQPIDLTVTTTNGMITWSPDNGTVSDINSLSPTLTPQESQWFYTSNTIAECTAVDSVWVQIDSLPDLTITDLTDEAPYCPGETIVLATTTYEPSLYQGIEHLWYPDNQFLTPDTNFNMVISTTQAMDYFRITELNACRDTASIFMEVVVPPTMTINTPDAVCSGESVQLTATSDSTDVTWEWMPTNGLSCTDCPNPTAAPFSTTTYTVQATTQAGICPGSATTTVTINSSPQYQFPNNTTICLGDNIALNNISATGTYSWTSPTDPSFGTQTISQPIVSPTTAQTYVLVLSNTDGSCEIMDEITISVAEEINIIPLDDVLLCADQPYFIEADATPTTQNGIWTWTTTLDAPITNAGNTLTVGFTSEADSGIVNVVYANACYSVDDSFTIIKEATDDCTLVLPNIFSPNNDNLNDYFLPRFGGSTTKVVLLEVFDRWGSKIYSEESPTLGWNGQNDGKDSPTDVYIYKVTYTDINGDTVVEGGDISLVR